MRRELQTPQWSLAGVILLVILLCLCMIRMRRSLNYGKTASTSGTSVETIGVQSSPPESSLMSPRGRGGSVSTNSEISTPRERDSQCLKRPQCRVSTDSTSCCLVPTQFPCISRVWIAVTTQSGLNGQDPHSRNFPSCNEWFRRGGQNCNDGKDDVSVCADGGSNIGLCTRSCG